MDETDLVLSMLLLQNSRTPYRQLADKLSLSVPSVHKRIQAMREAGIIRAFTARVSLFAVGGLHLLVFGRSDAPSSEDVPERLRKNDSIYWVTIAGGNYLYVGAYLKDLSGVESFVEFVKREAKMPDPTVGIESLETGGPLKPPEERSLDSLDCGIIKSLHEDSRKSISEVADELGVSAKTAGRHLQRMMDGFLIELSMEWYPDASNDIMTLFHLRLKGDADKGKAMAVMVNKYSPHALFTWTFSNLPGFLLSMIWSNSMKELKDIRARLQNEPFVESIMPNVLYTGRIFQTWRDKIPLERARLTGRKD